MTVANTDVSRDFTSDGFNLTFAIPFSFVPGDAPAVTRVRVVDTLGNVTNPVLGTDFTLQPAGDNPSNVVFGVAPANGSTITIFRVSPRTQPQDLDSQGPNTPFSPIPVENQLDFLNNMS